ncbi:hypothetical protein J8L08_14460 [Bacteroides fragilis]|jgi:hypothetical protein|uniref:hypothetical protein n=1 Tax=Bacteroides fragilis TaxID=817 RepID=UPI00202F2ED1|nr:hypothetical protein [Bacteroides fragilis]MCM0276834.1 hypothetical protein [Bacteroides fragilis]DAM68208.1 MAG TPA: hypothetical protein [Caudoviricetes sp.]
MEGPHSLFGIVWQITTATGWTVDYILCRIPYPVLMLMLSDAPRYVKGDARASGKPEAAHVRALDFFQNLKKQK